MIDPDHKDLLTSGDRVPHDYDSAMALAMLWATGRLSHWNEIMSHETTAVAYEVQGVTQFENDRQKSFVECARADAAEVERWCAVARGFAAGALLELAKNPPVVVRPRPSPTTFARATHEQMVDAVEGLDDDALHDLLEIVGAESVERS